MVTVDRELDRYITLLRNKIRDRGYTQLEVQEPLGWGRSYISQLLTKQKSLRLAQVLDILRVIGVQPDAFFAELYGFTASHSGGGKSHRMTSGSDLPRQELRQLMYLNRGLIELLRQKGLITDKGLKAAVEKARREE